MRYALVFLTGAVLAAAAALAWPQDARKPHGVAAHYAELGLSPEQRAAIDPLLKQMEERVGPLCRAIAQQKRALYDELRADAPDRAKIDAAIEAAVDVRRDMQRALVDHLAAVKPILTPDQRVRLFDRLSAERR